MKRLILTIVALLLVGAGLGALIVAVTHRYDQFKQTQLNAQVQTVTVSQAASEVKAAQTADQTKYDALLANYTTISNECQKGVQAYAKLTTAQKAQTAAPNCLITARAE